MRILLNREHFAFILALPVFPGNDNSIDARAFSRERRKRDFEILVVEERHIHAARRHLHARWMGWAV
jgi:hypothetical protein